ncbi:MAG: glycosyltransferase, partial [Patescibacteria group bacterium]
MPKILFVVTQSEFGGAQHFLFNLNSHIRGEHETLVCAGADGGGEFFKVLRLAGIPCVELKHLRRAIRPIDDLLCFFEIISTIRHFSPDIIFLNSSKAGVLGTIAASACRWLGKRFTLIYRIDWAFNDPRPAFERKVYIVVERFLSKFRDIIIQNDSFDLHTARVNGIKPKLGFKIIHNGIDVDALQFFDRDAARIFFRDRLRVNLNDFEL